MANYSMEKFVDEFIAGQLEDLLSSMYQSSAFGRLAGRRRGVLDKLIFIGTLILQLALFLLVGPRH
jgi:hypothetical protein